MWKPTQHSAFETQQRQRTDNNTSNPTTAADTTMTTRLGAPPGGVLGALAASSGGCGRQAFVDCGPTAAPKFIDCSDLDSLPRCGFIREALNLSDRPIEIQAYFQDSDQWRTVIPSVEPQSTYEVPQGAIWLPKQTLLRSAVRGTHEEIQVFGALGDGARLVQR